MPLMNWEEFKRSDKIPTVMELSKERAWSIDKRTGKVVTRYPSLAELEQELNRTRRNGKKRTSTDTINFQMVFKKK